MEKCLDNKSLEEDLMNLVKATVEASAVLRLAFNEHEESKNVCIESAHRIKLNEVAIGRDIEVYVLMAMIDSWRSALCDFVIEVIMPLKVLAPEAYTVAINHLRLIGAKVYDAKELKEFEDLL